MLFLQDPDLIITAIAMYIVKTRKWSLILENDQTQSVLSFETNTNLTLRILLKDEQLFIKLCLRIVQLNDSDLNMDEEGAGRMNALILDKVHQHE